MNHGGVRQQFNSFSVVFDSMTRNIDVAFWVDCIETIGVVGVNLGGHLQTLEIRLDPNYLAIIAVANCRHHMMLGRFTDVDFNILAERLGGSRQFHRSCYTISKNITMDEIGGIGEE